MAKCRSKNQKYCCQAPVDLCGAGMMVDNIDDKFRNCSGRDGLQPDFTQVNVRHGAAY